MRDLVGVAAGWAADCHLLRQVAGASGMSTRIETVVVGCLSIGLSLFSDVLHRARPAGALSDL